MTKNLTKRRLAALSVPVLLAFSLTACGGPGGDAPEGASVDEFCEAYNSDVGDDADAAQEAADKLAEVGTPDEIEGEAREGFEVFVDKLDDVSDDDIKDFEDADSPEDVFGDDSDKVQAFITKATELCLDIDSEDLPDTEDLQSELDDLESELPTDAPS